MSFTREHLLLKHNGGGTKLAFSVFELDSYAGGTDFKFEQLGRNGSGDLVRVTLASTKREWRGMVQADESGGSVIYDTTYTLGSPAQLKAALADDDLEVKSFEDTVFWDAHATGQYLQKLVRPKGDIVRSQLRLIER